MAIPLGRPLPSASCDRPERRREDPPGTSGRRRMPAAPTWSCSRWGFPCRRRCRRRGALLPHRFTLAGRPVFRHGPAVYFLWHFPWGRPRRALPGTVPPWSPDFPPSPEGGERPSGRLALEIWDFASCVSKPEGACTQTAAWDFMGCITSAAHGRIGIVPRGCASIIAANHPGTAEKGERHAGNTRNRRLPVRGRR